MRARGWNYQSIHNYIKFHELVAAYPRVLVSTKNKTLWFHFFSKFVEYLEEHEDLQIRLSQPLKDFEEEVDEFENAQEQLHL